MITDPNDFVRDPRRPSGPRTEEGKAKSARNSLKFGLFTAHDFVREGEEEEHAKILTCLMDELDPENTTEELFALEIMGATWRLRRCRLIEESFGRLENLDVDPLIDERTEKQQKSVDRARAQSHLILRRSLAELHKLRKGRTTPVPEPEPEPVEKIFALTYREREGDPPYEIVYTDGRHWRAGDPQTETDKSFCNPAPKPQPPAAAAPKMTPRNAPCPCKSGAKYKRCCGEDAPPVLNRAA